MDDSRARVITCNRMLALPDEILIEVLDILHHQDPQAFGAIRCTSKRCCALSDAIFYTSVSLHNWTDTAFDERYNDQARREQEPVERLNPLIENLAMRLSDPDDSLRHIVRALTIGPYRDGVAIVDSASVCAIITNLTNLRDFHWNTGLDPPASMLALLTQHHATANLHVSQLSRYHSILNEDLLSYPLLKSLELRLVTERIHGDQSISEFPVLNRSLAFDSNLESLTLVTDSRIGEYHGDSTDLDLHPERYLGPRCLSISYRVPLFMRPLKRFLIDEEFDTSSSVFKDWIIAMDWSQLEYLGLGTRLPRHLIQGLTDQVPRLTGMRIKLDRQDSVDPTRHLRLDDLENFESFLAAAHRLADITCAVARSAIWQETLRLLLHRNGRTLRRLSIRSTASLYREHWNIEKLSALSASAPDLTELAIELGLPSSHDKMRLIWDQNLEHSFVKFSKLRRLRIALPMADFSSRGQLFFDRVGNTISLNRAYVDDIIHSLFRAFSQSGPFHPIEMIEVLVYEAFGHDLNWRFQARRVSFPIVDGPSCHISVKRTGHIRGVVVVGDSTE